MLSVTDVLPKVGVAMVSKLKVNGNYHYIGIKTVTIRPGFIVHFVSMQ